MRRFACVMLVAGCASPDPRSVAEPTITADATHVASSGAVTYDLRFETGGLHLPEQLMFHGDNWIVGGDLCAKESGVGVNLYPAIRAVASTHGGDDASAGDPSTITVELAGPVIARVRTHWAVDYTCEGHANTASGDLVLTLFPSGRIVRRDEHVIASHTPLTNPAGACGCGSSGTYFLTSSWAFPDGAGARDEQDGIAPPEFIQRACAMYENHGIAVAWPDDHTRIHPNGANAFVYDWARDASSLNTGEHELTTTMQLGLSGSCGALLASLATPDLRIGGQLAMLGEDGIYTQTGVHTGTFTITSASEVPAGWAVGLDLGGAEHVKVSGAGDGGYVLEADPLQERTLIYFLDALAAGSTTTVEAE